MTSAGRAAFQPAAGASAAPRSAPVRSVVGVVIVVVWGLMTHGTFAGSGDEPHYLIVAQSLAFDGDFDLANNYAMPGNLIGGGSLAVETHARAGRGGVLRPAHDVGLPVLFAPVVRVAYPLAQTLAATVPPAVLERARLNDILIFRHLIGLCMAGLAAALAVQMMHVFRRMVPSRAAAGWALLFTLSPPLLAHAFLFFTELPSALLIVWLYRALTASERQPARWMLIGAATGLLLFVHVRNIGAVVVLGVWAAYLLWSCRAPGRDWLAWVGGMGLVMACRASLLCLFWGTLLTSPLAVSGDVSQPFVTVLWESFVRLTGLLFDQEFGLLVYAPIYLLALPGLWRIGRRAAPGAGWAAAIVAMYAGTVIVPYVNIHGWTGGWAPPARMIAPVVPLLGLAVVACARSASGAGRGIVAAIVALQLLIDAVVWQWPKSLWNYGDGTSALLPPGLTAWLPAWHGPAASSRLFIVCAAAWILLAWILTRGRARVSEAVR